MSNILNPEGDFRGLLAIFIGGLLAVLLNVNIVRVAQGEPNWAFILASFLSGYVLVFAALMIADLTITTWQKRKRILDPVIGAFKFAKEHHKIWRR